MFDTILESAKALYGFLVIVTKDSPIGMWSMAGALTLPALLGPYLYKYIPPSHKYPLRRQLIIDLIMIAAGTAFAYLPWQTLPGLMVGIAGGLGSSAFWRLMQTVFGPLWLFVMRKLGVADYKAPTT
jgi:hypothetical protein